MAIHVLPWTVRVTLDVEARPDMALLDKSELLRSQLVLLRMAESWDYRLEG